MAPDLATAAQAAVLGGRAALSYYGSRDLDVRRKGENDPVTAADHASNQAALAAIHRDRPEDPILSEESPPPVTDRLADRMWALDPLDGTKEFIAQNGEFSVMVGLATHGAAVLGAVYQPAHDELYLGIVDRGAWHVAGVQHAPAARPLRIAGSPGVPLRFVRSRSHPDATLQNLQAALHPVDVVVSGSVGVKCALIASGGADLYVHPVPFLKEWDTCGPEAVLRGAGGIVTDCAGQRLRYGKQDLAQRGGIFAARSDVWHRVAPVVQSETGALFES